MAIHGITEAPVFGDHSSALPAITEVWREWLEMGLFLEGITAKKNCIMRKPDLQLIMTQKCRRHPKASKVLKPNLFSEF